MFKKLWQKKTQPATQQETVEDVERKKFIQYALDVEETLRILEQCLHKSDDSYIHKKKEL